MRSSLATSKDGANDGHWETDANKDQSSSNDDDYAEIKHYHGHQKFDQYHDCKSLIVELDAGVHSLLLFAIEQLYYEPPRVYTLFKQEISILNFSAVSTPPYTALSIHQVDFISMDVSDKFVLVPSE